MKDIDIEKFRLSRRSLAVGALAGGASLALGVAAMAKGESASEGGLLDVRHFGAKGDGKTVDTKAIQSAIDAAAGRKGSVFFPPGLYLSGEIQLQANVALVGVPSWSYRSSGDTTIKLVDKNASCLINITGSSGATIDGLALDGGHLGSGIHGIFLNKPNYGRHEDAFRIERCQVARFTGDGLSLKRAWCFSVRHSMLASNHGDGLRLRGWDGFLIDNWFSGNRGAGFGAHEENASVTMTANRIEWNGKENILIAGGNGYNITGNFLDRAGTSGIALVARGKTPCSEMTITGNYFRRSGKYADAASYSSSQIRMEDVEGITCVGNSLRAGQDDGSHGVWSPSYGIVCKNATACVIANNVLHRGAIKKLVVDLGGHGEGVIVKDNPGSLFAPKT
ncbi:MAG: glycosyl hydrolase family 28-related protein [Acidobacteriota bacterium]